MSVQSEYPHQSDLVLLEQSARNLLGWEIEFKDLHIAATTSPALRAMVLNTHKQAVMAISEIKFFPTQDGAWQEKISKRVIDGETRTEDRNPMQIFTTSMMGNPLVSAVLQRGPNAKTDPLAVFTRMMVATGKKNVEELPWKKVLVDALGVPAKQINQLLQAMNFAPALGHPSSPVQLHRLTRLTLPKEDLEPPAGSHDDLHSQMVLSSEGKEKLKGVLLNEWAERNS